MLLKFKQRFKETESHTQLFLLPHCDFADVSFASYPGALLAGCY